VLPKNPFRVAARVAKSRRQLTIDGGHGGSGGAAIAATGRRTGGAAIIAAARPRGHGQCRCGAAAGELRERRA